MEHTEHDRFSLVRQGTELDYRTRLNQIFIYIQEHLDEPLNLEDLAKAASFSPYHVHHIFSAFVGESLGNYLRRMRMGRAWVELTTTRKSVLEIGLSVGYDTHAAFTRAFRQVYGVSPSQARQMDRKDPPSVVNPTNDASSEVSPKPRSIIMQPEIRTLPQMNVIYVLKKGIVDGNFNQAAGESFKVLCKWIDQKKLWNSVDNCLGICPDETGVTAPEECRYLGGFFLKEGVQVQPEGEVQLTKIAAGRWAVFTHKGPYDYLWQTWNAAYRDWLPTCGMKLRDEIPFEVYLSDAEKVKPEDLVTEIFIAVE